ncbi:alpha/beta hydrolase [Bdellovibrio sp. HCB2-146]|uniref:alpha/beta hydrolase n=1 Tax=Bdellovibrio sp. HCB2-146 TaxID=3394362 RepID=UPI0039BD6433
MKSTVRNLISITSLFRFAATVLALASLGCSSMLYYPKTEKLFDPARVQLEPEDIYFKSSDGNMLHAWYFASKTKENKGTVLFFHGNGENLTSHFLTFRWLPEQGYSYLIFDYPGYGTSSGKPSPEGTVKAGIAAAEWLVANKKPTNLIIYGASLGGNVALRTAEEIKGRIPFNHVIIEASFPSYRKMGAQVLSRSWITWLFQPIGYLVLSDKWAPKDISQFSPTPMLFIAGDKDWIVEPEQSQKLFELAKDPKEIWIIPGGHHGDLYEINKGELRGRLLQYLEKK